jgi:hypothetical protein
MARNFEPCARELAEQIHARRCRTLQRAAAALCW